MRRLTCIVALAACLDGAAASAAEPPTIASPVRTLTGWEQGRASAVGAINRGYDPARWDGALAALDASDRAADPDLFLRRSFLVGNQLLRAYIQARRGRQEEALAATRAAVAARPYAPEIGWLAARIDRAATNDLDAYRAALRANARFDPALIAELYFLAMLRGDFREAVALYPQIAVRMPVDQGNYRLQEAGDLAMEALLRRTELAGSDAYAHAALGEADAAGAALAEAQAGIEQALNPPRGTPDNLRLNSQQRRTIGDRRGEVDAVVARWRQRVALRLHPADGATATATAALLAGNPPFDPALADLARAVLAAQPGNGAVTAEAVAALEARRPQALDRYTGLADSVAVGNVPPLETVDAMPDYAEGTPRDRVDRDVGYLDIPGPGPNAMSLRFASARTPVIAMGEILLMRAAVMAREHGVRGFIILDRQVISRSFLLTGDFTDGEPERIGVDLQFDVLFVDPAALPRGYESAGWRVIDADAAWTALQPIYVAERERLRGVRPGHKPPERRRE